MLFQRSQKAHTTTTVATRMSFAIAPDLSGVCRLADVDEKEVKSFLAVRPVHNVVMTSFIADNGMVSELNRGEFYGFRGPDGNLQGVALIGHSTLVEARTDDALMALALVARVSKTPIHLIMSSGDAAARFWTYLHGESKKPSVVCRELLFEVGFPFLVRECKYELRLARPEELESIAIAQAEVAELECGINPMERDRQGFLRRVLRRIEQGRIFVVFDGVQLVFKADVIAETDSTAYIEGVYVSPAMRGNGVAPECLSRVCRELLGRVQTVCLLSNVKFEAAHRSFMKAGMRSTDICTTLFV